MSKCTFILGFLCWCLVVLLQTEVSSWLLSPKSKRKLVSNYSELWYEAQCLPELFVGWCNLHTIVCSSLCLKNSLSKVITICKGGQVWNQTSFPVSLAAFRDILQSLLVKTEGPLLQTKKKPLAEGAVLFLKCQWEIKGDTHV